MKDSVKAYYETVISDRDNLATLLRGERDQVRGELERARELLKRCRLALLGAYPAPFAVGEIDDLIGTERKT